MVDAVETILLLELITEHISCSLWPCYEMMAQAASLAFHWMNFDKLFALAYIIC